MHNTPKADLPPSDGKTASPAARDERLKAALKANMARRKAQAKARQDAAPDNDNKDE